MENAKKKLNSRLNLKSHSSLKKSFFSISIFVIWTFILNLTFFAGLVKAEASLSNQGEICSEIFLNSEKLYFEKGIQSLAKSTAQLILENTGRPNDLIRDMHLEKIKNELKIHVTTKEQIAQFKQLVLKYQEELKFVIAERQKIQIEKEKQREKKLKEQEREIIERSHPLNLNYKVKMIFHEIKPGNFDMKYEVSENQKIVVKTTPVTLTKSYALAQYQTTQMQWAYIKILMGEVAPKRINPSIFKKGPNSVVVDFELRNGEIVQLEMQPDNPVERVSWDDVKDWIKELNNLSQTGDEIIQKELQRVIPGHLKGDIYDLPTEAQWAYVMQNRGKNNEKYYFDSDETSDIKNYAVYYGNSKINDYRGTHTVGSKLARKINRGDGIEVDFYDLEGNVYEWINDLYSENLSGGIDPQGVVGREYVIRGASWGSDPTFLRSSYRGSNSSHDINDGNKGFRLMRSRQ